MASIFGRPPAMVQSTHDLTVIHFTGRSVRLDGATLSRIHNQLLALADEPDAADLLFDFGNVDYVFGRALGTLVVLHKKLLARGRSMSISNLRPRVHEVFAAMRLEKYLNLVFPEPFSIAEALGTHNPRTTGPHRRRQHRWIIPH